MSQSDLLKDYDYVFPKDLVAQEPLVDRSASRMMVLNPAEGKIQHDHFISFPQWVQPEDLLVINNTSVLPCRFFAQKETGGKVEILALRKTEDTSWEGWMKPQKGLTKGRRLQLFSRSTGNLLDLWIEIHSAGPSKVLFSFASPDQEASALSKHGEMPLPPYIKRPHPRREDRWRYQTVFARRPGAIAAPTAGLHFSEAIFTELRKRKIALAEVTLHVGVGTFAPVKTERIAQHQMHREFYEIPERTLRALEDCRRRGGRVVAVGTTSLRALESWALTGKKSGWTDLFIRPGYRPRLVQDLLTNFHQPRSTLLVLVCAWAGRDFILKAYDEAMAKGYRLFSYGDCMLIRKGEVVR